MSVIVLTKCTRVGVTGVIITTDTSRLLLGRIHKYLWHFVMINSVGGQSRNNNGVYSSPKEEEEVD